MARRTPLFESHRRLGARFVEFAGWEMPLDYGDATAEHRAVRTACGVFDVSHMGQLWIRGSQAGAVWQRVTTNDVRRLGDGDAQYTVACAEDGGVLDDLIVYRWSATEWLGIVNAANTDAMRAWIGDHIAAGATLRDESAEWALLAVQGPRAGEVLGSVGAVDREQPAFTIRPGVVAGCATWLSRTGYTGEDGWEVLVPAAQAPVVWERLIEALGPVGGRPAGLAARDTLRLEAALPLCGSDMGPRETPLQAGLGWAVRFVDGNDFIGRSALERERAAGVARRLVCFELEGAGVPRHGFVMWCGNDATGVVTSGARSPTLGRFIGMGYVPAAAASPGTAIEIEMRGRRVPARVVPRPFYRRAG